MSVLKNIPITLALCDHSYFTVQVLTDYQVTTKYICEELDPYYVEVTIWHKYDENMVKIEQL